MHAACHLCHLFCSAKIRGVPTGRPAARPPGRGLVPLQHSSEAARQGQGSAEVAYLSIKSGADKLADLQSEFAKTRSNLQEVHAEFKQRRCSNEMRAIVCLCAGRSSGLALEGMLASLDDSVDELDQRCRDFVSSVHTLAAQL